MCHYAGVQERQWPDDESLLKTPGAVPDVLLVVVTYNSEDHVRDLLASVPATVGPLSAHVVVVDNGSSDGTRAAVRATPGTQLIESTNIGYAGALNLGIRASPPTDAIVVLNPDCVLYPDCIHQLVLALAEDRVAATVPLMLGPDGHRVNSIRRDPSILRALGLNRTGTALFSEYVVEDSAYLRRRAVDWATGAVMAFRRQVWDELGGWDESYFLYSEETDFCLRARDHGWVTVFVPDARVMHVGGGSGRNDRTHTMQIINRVRLYARRHGRVLGAGYWLATIASELSWWARGQPASTRVAQSIGTSGRPAC